MPIYPYRCSACGFETEVMRKISDPLLTTCPQCQSEQFSKQLTAPGFQLKGTGWYATDFKNSGAKPAAGKESKSSQTNSEDNSETVSPSPPAAATETGAAPAATAATTAATTAAASTAKDSSAGSSAAA